MRSKLSLEPALCTIVIASCGGVVEFRVWVQVLLSEIFVTSSQPESRAGPDGSVQSRPTPRESATRLM